MRLKHNQYLASLELSQDTQTFIGKVLHLTTPIYFYGSGLSQLQTNFALAVAHKPPTVQCNGRIPLTTTPEKHSQWRTKAANCDMNLNQYITHCVDQYENNTH